MPSSRYSDDTSKTTITLYLSQITLFTMAAPCRRRRGYHQPVLLLICGLSIVWKGESLAPSIQRLRLSQSFERQRAFLQWSRHLDRRTSLTLTVKPDTRLRQPQSYDSFAVSRPLRGITSLHASSQDASYRGEEDRRPNNRPSTTASFGLLATLARLGVVLAFYLLHLMVLSQRQFVFPVQLIPNDRGHFTGLGWDSIAGMVSLSIYWMQQLRNSRKRTQGDGHATTNANAIDISSSLDNQHTSATLFPWNLPRDNLRFRLTTALTFFLLVQAYFLTGRMSIFWEDILYELSARDFAITIPLFRALTVLLGHLSWVAVGAALLRWLPRPPPFFQKRRVDLVEAPEDSEYLELDASDELADDDDFEEASTRTKIFKKLFRTDVSTLYTQSGGPSIRPSQIDVSPVTISRRRRRRKPARLGGERPSHDQPVLEPAPTEGSPYHWFTNGLKSNNWMWWTIGGYVSR
jgi:hypothetical protein